MNNTIICTNCGKEIDLPEALRRELQTQVRAEAEKETEEKVSKKLHEQFELKVQNLNKEHEEERKRNGQLLQELEKLSDEMRILRRKDEERELTMKKKIADEEEKIRQETLKKAFEEHELTDREKDKRLHDALKQVEELKVRMQQGSQQLQGEVQEEDLKEKLSVAFPQDTIEDIEKGVRGADLRQVVRTPRGNLCGVMLWESKRTKEWKDKWLTTLKENMRNEGATLPIIVSTVLPKEITGFGIKSGVYICEPRFAIVLGEILRERLIGIAHQKFLAEHKGGKAEAVYEYLTSHEFNQQLEAMVEMYYEMRSQIEKERTTLEKNLKVRETQVKQLFKSTINIYGTIQGVAGSTLPQVKGLEMLEAGDTE